MRVILTFLLLSIFSLQAQTESMKLKTPPYLQEGDTIAIVAPAGILKNREAVIDKAKKLAESWGLKVVLGKHVFSKAHHFAGTDEQRCQDFQDALDNPNIKAIWSARGGYGSVRILDRLDYTKFQENPKWIIGYSDVTAFHNHIHNLGVETLHAMMGISMQDAASDIPHTIATFKKALFGEQLVHKVAPNKFNVLGNTSGQLVGGNIAMLASMLLSLIHI